MTVAGNFIKGMLTVITVTAAPQLYRHPYRTSSEGLRGDMLRVGGDVESVLGRLEDAAQGRQRRKRRFAKDRHG